MLELFLNPLNVIVGGALISSPILIHLINRMRYRRVRWAAMEFLLKSQKRNRRRLIIEQLILLFLRILLVLLTALLLARFLGFSWAGFRPRNSLHVVILDDRLSMSDHWKNEDGEEKDCFQVAKQLLERELAKVVAVARTPQQLVLFPLSDPGSEIKLQLNEESLRELSKELGRWQRPTMRHLNLARGVAAATEILGKNPQDQRFLHVVSDFRQQHWREPEGSDLLKSLESLTKMGVKINLVDTAHPYRNERQNVALYHDNLAVVELRPETRIAAEGMPVQFTFTVANYSASVRKNVRVTIKVDGSERPEASRTLEMVRPGQTSATFDVVFVRRGFNEITATLDNEEAGLQADNVRYAVIEVRRQVPVLVIDGDLTGGDKPGGDTFHVRAVLTSARGYEIVRGGVAELERPNLDRYPGIYLLNVRELNDRALKNLENYVREGGSLAFFLGDRVNPDYYNKKLYAGGQGLFPAPLADRPSPQLSEEEQRERQSQNLLDPREQIFIRNEKDPIFADVWKYRSFFQFLTIDRYFPVPRSKWRPPAGRVEELVTLPNERPVGDYAATVRDTLESIPVGDAGYAAYRPLLEPRMAAVRDALGGKSLHVLANALDALLGSEDAGDTKGPRLKDLWEQTDPAIQAVKAKLVKLHETVRYGDPLVIAERFGRGRTVAFLTTAGKKWNDWAGGGPASALYPVVMLNLQKYLGGMDVEDNRTVGTPLEIQADSTRYDSKIRCYYQEAGREALPAGAGDNTARAGLKDLGELLGTASGNRLAFAFDKANTPGVYQFELIQRAEGAAEPKAEMRAFAFNVDTANESNLRRINREEIERAGALNTPTLGSFADLIERHHDLSESAWLYLLFLGILVIEQALAVHLSFHLKANEAPAASSGRPQATAA
jgi:hypothetical protein